MSTPGTFNYKLGADNAPMCHIVEDSGLRFDPADLDEKLNTLVVTITPTDTPFETVGFTLFNEGMELSVWEQWSRTQLEFNEGGCEHKWNSFHHAPNGISIASLYQWATEGGYVETGIQREYYQLNPSGQKTRSHRSEGMIDSLKAELRSVKKTLGDFDAEKKCRD